MTDTPELEQYASKPGAFLPYKGRAYTWVNISGDGEIVLTEDMMAFLKVGPGMKLLSIRSSDIAFTMGAKGPLVEESMKHEGEILVF